MFCYFTTAAPSKWNIVSYLTASYDISKQEIAPFNYTLAIRAYFKRLNELRLDPRPRISERARVLIDRWHEKGRLSDAVRARRWGEDNGHLSKLKRPAGPLPEDMGPPPKKQRQQRVRIGTYGEGLSSTDSALGSSREASGSVQSVDNVEATTPNIVPEPSVSSSDHPSDSERDSSPSPPPPPRYHTVLQHAYLHSTNKLLLSTGKYLEDMLYNHARQLDKIDFSHWWIVDETDKAVMALFPEGKVPVGSVMPLPVFPKVLNDHLKMYKFVVGRGAARELAFNTDKEWKNSEDGECGMMKKDPEMLYLKYWIDSCFEDAISLATESSHLLHERLKEGSWEIIYSRLVDGPYQNIPSILVQRKETKLHAHKYDTNPVLPYTVFYDGVVHTRAHRSPTKSVLEFAVIEVKSIFDRNKWQEDLTKVVAGCRAILRAIRASVDGHAPTMAKVVTAGILQAGAKTMVVLMNTVGENVYLLKKGSEWEYPEDVKDMSGLGDLIAALWKAREVVKKSYEAVMYYHEHVKGEKDDGDRTEANFL